jgi:hypothetical protein
MSNRILSEITRLPLDFRHFLAYLAFKPIRYRVETPGQAEALNCQRIARAIANPQEESGVIAYEVHGAGVSECSKQ